MTSSRKAALLLNFYTRSATFNWDICADKANGLVVTVNFRIPPRNEAWHYIGLVMCWAGLGPKALGWAGLFWAWASQISSPGPRPKLGWAWAGLGLRPGLLAKVTRFC